MPNPLTHKYVADAILLELDGRAKEIVEKHKKAYTLGALGPDIIMGLLFEKDPSLRDAGENLHTEDVYAGLCNTANYLAVHKEDEELCAYFFGFLTHYGTDSTIHPYVYYYIDNRLKRKYDPSLSTVLHTIVETEMDVYVGHVFLKGKGANSFYQFSGSRRMRRLVERYFLEVNKKVFSLVLTRKEIKKSFFFFKTLMFFTQRHKNGSLRYTLFERIDKRFRAEHLLMAALRPRRLSTEHDFLNFTREPYRSIHQEDQSELVDYTFPEMIEIAKMRGLEQIKKAMQHIDNGVCMSLKDFELNYNGGFNREYLQAVEEGLIDPRAHNTLTIEGFERLSDTHPHAELIQNALERKKAKQANNDPAAATEDVAKSEDET